MSRDLQYAFDTAVLAEEAPADHLRVLAVIARPCIEASSIKELLDELLKAHALLPAIFRDAEELEAAQGVARRITGALVLAARDCLPATAGAAQRAAEAAAAQQQAAEEQRQAAAQDRARIYKILSIKALCEGHLAVCMLGPPGRLPGSWLHAGVTGAGTAADRLSEFPAMLGTSRCPGAVPQQDCAPSVALSAAV